MRRMPEDRKPATLAAAHAPLDGVISAPRSPRLSPSWWVGGPTRGPVPAPSTPLAPLAPWSRPPSASGPQQPAADRSASGRAGLPTLSLRRGRRHRRAMTGEPEADAPVVVGVDGSPSSRDAVRWAADAAALRGTPLLLVRVTTRLEALSAASPGMPPSLLATQAEEARAHLHEATELATAAAGGVGELTMRTELGCGSAAGVLLDRAHAARLLVVGTRGLGELAGGLVGSVSSAVAAHAACPVVIVRGLPAAEEPPLAGPVVVGVDASRTSAPAVAAAFEEASLRGAELVAVHAWTDLDLAAVFELDSPHQLLDHEDLARGQELLLAEALASGQQRYPDVPVTRVVVADRLVSHLLERAQSAQLVVAGSHGHGGFTSMLLGSTSRALLHSVPCPLMVVRSPSPR